MGRYLDLIRSLESRQTSQACAQLTPEPCPLKTIKGADIRRVTPAQSLIDTCREHGVGLRVDPDGVLVVESYGRAWRSLIRALDTHAHEIASILIADGQGQGYALRRVEA
jgi:hypothetical protein